MVLASVESNPIILMRFTSKASDELIRYTIERLSVSGIIVVVVTEGYDGSGGSSAASTLSSVAEIRRRGDSVVLGLTTTEAYLESEAEIVKMVKPSRTQNSLIPIIMEHFTVDAREDFVNIDFADLSFNEDLAKHLPKMDENDYDSDRLFTSGDRALLLLNILDAIPVLRKDEVKSDLSSLFDSLKVTYTEDDPVPSVGDKPQELQRHSKSVIQVLKNSGFVDMVGPLHISHAKEKILKETISIWTGMPIQSIRNYYGEGIAFHFEWMDFTTKWFTPLGFLGIAVFIIRTYRGDTIDNCDFTPFFGLATFFWAVLCDRFWERRESRLSYFWGTYASTYRDRVSFGQRQDFVGEMRRSPVTGKMEKYYPSHKRLLKFAISTICTVALLSGAALIMIISMNVQGYISKQDLKQWGEVTHPLYFPWFARLAEEGQIFDSNSVWKGFIPVIFRALVVFNMNKQFRHVAEQLTEWENHETTADHENSMILKRVLFEAFDAYIILFYLAIYERNIHLLRLELIGAFNVDTFRRVLTECIIPYVVQKRSSRGNDAKSKKNSDKQTPQCCSPAEELELDEYEQFGESIAVNFQCQYMVVSNRMMLNLHILLIPDDYIEMMIQFGYVTLFASAFPLAAIIAAVANLIEYRADLWKLTRLCKRPTPCRVEGIGMWKQILRVMVWTSALTNCLIFAFTSNQMRQWLPSNYTTDEFGRSVLAPHSADETVLIMFAIEHVIILAGMLVRGLVGVVPNDVLDEVDRSKWLHEASAQKLRLMRSVGEIENKSEELKEAEGSQRQD